MKCTSSDEGYPGSRKSTSRTKDIETELTPYTNWTQTCVKIAKEVKEELAHGYLRRECPCVGSSSESVTYSPTYPAALPIA
jgi:hypothetical protein